MKLNKQISKSVKIKTSTLMWAQKQRVSLWNSCKIHVTCKCQPRPVKRWIATFCLNWHLHVIYSDSSTINNFFLKKNSLSWAKQLINGCAKGLKIQVFFNFQNWEKSEFCHSALEQKPLLALQIRRVFSLLLLHIETRLWCNKIKRRFILYFIRDNNYEAAIYDFFHTMKTVCSY